MLHVSLNPYRLTIRESVGIAHESQVVEVPIPATAPALFKLRDESTGSLYPVQSSQRKAGFGYLLLAIEPNQVLSLVPDESGTDIEIATGIAIEAAEETWLVSNGKFTIELSSGRQQFGKSRLEPVPGPVRRIREASGPWRGRTFFDTLNAPLREQATWPEKGPLRSIYHYRIEFAEGGFYELELTADATLDFARLHETFRGAASDQIVWAFSGSDLPERLSLLDSTAAYTPRWLHYHLDQRHARLWCWTQYSQLHDLSDGLALHFTGSDDVVGLVALDGGKWSGNALNHLESWTRRWQASDLTTRRLPGETKADSFPGIDSIPARGSSVNEPHFTWEGWLRQGERHFALVLSTVAKITPPIENKRAEGEQGCSVALGHFEEVPRRDLYSLQQARLRKINIQYGQLPLQDQLGLTFDWPLEAGFLSNTAPLSEALRHALQVCDIHHGLPSEGDPDGIKSLDDYLAARVYGFWEGSGAAYTNCVVSRGVGPSMLRFEALAKEGKLSMEQIMRWRAWFSFLAHLNHTDNYYPGPSTMEGIGSRNPVEPTMAGMSNQNFYTDVIALFGFAAQAFPAHPSTAAWRDKFLANWHRQLEYHMYPKSGVWEESHTYYQHILSTVLPLCLRRKADGTRDDFADKAFQKFVAGAIPQLTPPNAVVGGSRHIVTFGDHGADPAHYRSIYRELARALIGHAPELAGNLAWVYREMKGNDLTDVTALAPKLATGYLEGLGFFFRGDDGAGGESLLALRSGMAWGHHHNDDGSIQFYARGRALIVDSASSQPQERRERKALSPGHSRAVMDGVEPYNHLWRFNRGWILDSRISENFSYAVAGTPSFITVPSNLPPTPLRRALWELRAAIELAPAVYLIADYLDASQKHTVRFHVANPAVTLDGSSASASFGDGCRLEITPLFQTASPSLSIDRPVNLAKVPQENTTAVEYGGVTGSWSLFVIAALDNQERLQVSHGPETVQITARGKTISVQLRGNSSLEFSNAGSVTPDILDAKTLLAKLQAGARQ